MTHISDVFYQLLSQLHHEFIPAAAMYISVHLDRILQVCETIMYILLPSYYILLSYTH